MRIGCPDIVMYLFFSGAGLRQIDRNVGGGSHGGVETGEWTGICIGMVHGEQT
jgi:hypothetical protein